MHVFDAESGALERSVRSPEGARAFGFRLAPLGGDRVAVGTSDDSRRIYVLDVRSGAELLALRTPAPGDDYNGAFVTAGNRIVVGVPGDSGPAPGGTVYVHHAKDGRLLRTIANPGGPSEAFGAALAVEGRKLLVGAPFPRNCDGGACGPPSRATIYLFDVRTGRLRGRLSLDDGGLSAYPPVFLGRGFAYALPYWLFPDGGQDAQVVYRSRLPR